jgi:hypothetical protein
MALVILWWVFKGWHVHHWHCEQFAIVLLFAILCCILMTRPMLSFLSFLVFGSKRKAATTFLSLPFLSIHSSNLLVTLKSLGEWCC